MGIVLILGFVSEFSSLATFAGFITAGLAVGLQTILLSVAAYFFLVGRWGIRVGDRISVAGVTGDVVDVGLVRLYLMELAGTGVDLYPTGRIVVFSNSVLFQATTPLFKQLPGSEYAWHEVAVALNPGGKYDLVESQLLEAVRSVHSGYGDELQRQLGTTERRIDIQMKVPEPHGPAAVHRYRPGVCGALPGGFAPGFRSGREDHAQAAGVAGAATRPASQRLRVSQDPRRGQGLKRGQLRALVTAFSRATAACTAGVRGTGWKSERTSCWSL